MGLVNRLYPQLSTCTYDLESVSLVGDTQLAKDGVPPLHAVTPSSFIVFGLELEDQQ